MLQFAKMVTQFINPAGYFSFCKMSGQKQRNMK